MRHVIGSMTVPGKGLMEELVSFGQSFSGILQHVATGMEMFGDHGVLLWAIPPLWGIAVCLIWMNFVKEEQARDGAYVACAERNLPKLRELPKQRSTEILDFRSARRPDKTKRGRATND